MNEFLSTGAIERTPDPRDYPLGAVTPTTIPTVFTQDLSNLTVEMQNKIPACGSHAGAFLKNIQETLQRATPQRTSPEYLWKRIKSIDNIPPEDGTTMVDIFKALQTYGVCSNELLPNNTTQDLSSYTDPIGITFEMDSDALNNRIGPYAFKFSPSFDDIKQAIYAHKAVIVLIRLGKEFWTPSWAEKDILPLRPPQTVAGGHFVVAYAYDEKYIYFRNEWSSAWGRNGDGYFGEDYLPFVAEIGTAADFIRGRFDTNLGYGSVGVDVVSLQKFLVDNKYGDFYATGFFGVKTKAAVIEFQKDHGIQQTGYVGPITRSALNKLIG